MCVTSTTASLSSIVNIASGQDELTGGEDTATWIDGVVCTMCCVLKDGRQLVRMIDEAPVC